MMRKIYLRILLVCTLALLVVAFFLLSKELVVCSVACVGLFGVSLYATMFYFEKDVNIKRHV